MNTFTDSDVAELARDLRSMGIPEGATLLVQASLGSVGPVHGGADTLVRALRTVLGPTGTLVAYTATPENSDTSPQFAAATAGLDDAGVAAYRASMPAFHRRRTPASPTMGRLSEAVRTTPGALRSNHPQTSFAALGPAAAELTKVHPLTCHLGDESPLGALYRGDALLLLVDIDPVLRTAFHLADYRVPGRPVKRYGCVVRGLLGRRRWVHFTDVDLDHTMYHPAMHEAVAPALDATVGTLGRAPCLLMSVRRAADLATAWLTVHG